MDNKHLSGFSFDEIVKIATDNGLVKPELVKQPMLSGRMVETAILRGLGDRTYTFAVKDRLQKSEGFALTDEWKHLTPQTDDVVVGSTIVIMDRASTPGEYGKGLVVGFSTVNPDKVIVEWIESDGEHRAGDVFTIRKDEVMNVRR